MLGNAWQRPSATKKTPFYILFAELSFFQTVTHVLLATSIILGCNNLSFTLSAGPSTTGQLTDIL